jgi:hypothetical protein
VTLGDRFRRLEAESDQNRVDFLRTDLRACFTFADVALTQLQIGKRENAERALADSEKGYESVSRFLSDRKHADRLSEEVRREFAGELERLRQTLDELRDRMGRK